MSRNVTLVWAALCAVTLVSGAVARSDGYAASTAATVAVLLLAAVKGRAIIRSFMEVGTAPRWLRLGLDAWLVLLWGGMLGLYLA